MNPIKFILSLTATIVMLLLMDPRSFHGLVLEGTDFRGTKQEDLADRHLTGEPEMGTGMGGELQCTLKE